jgi:hypothetical protein
MAEIQELHEQAQEGKERSMAGVTLTMSVLAILVAATSLLGHRSHTEELLHQNEASDRWAEYQAKSIRRHGYEQVVDLLAVLNANAELGRELKEKYEKEAEKAKSDQGEIMEKAKDLEAERDRERMKADRFDLGEVILEASLVITSLCLLTGKRSFWAAGGILALIGLVVGLAGFLGPLSFVGWIGR